MNAVRKQRLMLIVFLVCGIAVAVGLGLMALQENINLYFSPAQMEKGEAPVGKTIRGGGLVVAGSVVRSSESLEVKFGITDGDGTVTVQYDGILPDLFQEGQGVVATGKLNEQGEFVATEILAKHDSNYMPPEVQDAIDKAHTPEYGAAEQSGTVEG